MISRHTTWYCIWYHRLPIPCATMISYKTYDIWYHLWYSKKYDLILHIIPYIIPVPFLALSLYDFAYYIIYISCNFAYEIRILWLRPLISVLRDICAIWISQIWWYHSLCHGTCAAGWRGLGAPGARCSSASCLAIANVLGTCVQQKSDGLHPAHGLVVAAARVIRRGRFVVI
jgi:hypothetical protein